MLLHHLRKVQLHGIAFDQREIVRPAHGFPQHGIEPGVQLHGYHLSGTAGKLLGKRADTGTDLQHTGTFISAAAVGDIPGHPALNEKILPHCLGKMKAMALQQGLYFAAVTKIHCCLLLICSVFTIAEKTVLDKCCALCYHGVKVRKVILI